MIVMEQLRPVSQQRKDHLPHCGYHFRFPDAAFCGAACGYAHAGQPDAGERRCRANQQDGPKRAYEHYHDLPGHQRRRDGQRGDFLKSPDAVYHCSGPDRILPSAPSAASSLETSCASSPRAKSIRSSVRPAFPLFLWRRVFPRRLARRIIRATSCSCMPWAPTLPALSVRLWRQASCFPCLAEFSQKII